MRSEELGSLGRSRSGLSRATVVSGSTALRVPYGLAASEPTTSTVVTAEIPAVPVGPKYGVLMPDGTIWYPGNRKKLPAPLLLRVLVWALAFLVILAAVGDFIVHTHPAWVNPLRRHVPAAGASLPAFTAPTLPHHAAAPRLSLTMMSPQPANLPRATTAYAVKGTSSYTVSVHTTELTYMKAFSLVNGYDYGVPLFAGELAPGTTQVVSGHGPIDVQVDAGGTTVSVLSGGRKIGTVANPPYVPWDFWFQPARS